MKQWLRRAKELIQPKAMVLMYHRIAEAESDVWDIVVSPEHFEQQLQVLKKSGNVISLTALAEGLRTGNLQRDSVAISFDDGYEDNFTTARPMLEKWGLPATFFITTGNLGEEKEFWWDELEQLILFTEELPDTLEIRLGGTLFQYDLERENHLSAGLRQQHRQWRGSEQEPPTRRARLYLKLWQHLQPLPYADQQEALKRLRTWAGVPLLVREQYKSMSVAQLQELASSELFDIGIHTLTHPALAYHSKDYQAHEILENRQLLERLTGKRLELLAFPYGNYQQNTLEIVADAKLKAAFTTEERMITPSTHPYRMGRFQVKDWSANSFEQHLLQWRKGK